MPSLQGALNCGEIRGVTSADYDFHNTIGERQRSNFFGTCGCFSKKLAKGNTSVFITRINRVIGRSAIYPDTGSWCGKEGRTGRECTSRKDLIPHGWRYRAEGEIKRTLSDGYSESDYIYISSISSVSLHFAQHSRALCGLFLLPT